MILVISNMYPSKKYPNYGVFVRNFVDQLSKDEQVKVVSMTKKSSKWAKLIGYLMFYCKVFFQYVFGNYKLVYVHYAGYNSPPIILGRIFNRKSKLIVNVHGSDVTPEKPLEEKTNFMTKILVRKADLTVVPSTYFKSVVQHKYGRIPIYVSPSAGVNLQLFSKNDIPKENNEYTIGYVSRIDEEKGWDTLLKAFKNVKQVIPHIHLIMVGGGAQEASAIEMIKDLDLEDSVTKIRMLSQKELVNIYNSLDAFIFPSTRAGESLGLVGLESMACGTPVIGSNFGGIKTYVKDGYNGYLFKPGNQEELEKTILKFHELSIDEKERMSNNSLETAKSYDSKLVNAKLISKVKEVLRGDR